MNNKSSVYLPSLIHKCRNSFVLAVAVMIFAATWLQAEPPRDTLALWTSDQGDGTYRNPVLYADYSDPDAIRVGDDYWMTSSSFNHVPGLPILHSKDLVNWTLVNHALPALVPLERYSKTLHSGGVYAPSIRYHAGQFWIFYPDPDFGIYMVMAKDPRGKWSDPVLVQGGKGYIDPCPLWDEDGKAYLVWAWAASRVGKENVNRLTLQEMSPDGTKLLGQSVHIIDGRNLGWGILEGPKLYKRDGYYWVFAPANGVKVGFQGVYRARNIWGPYENRNVLHQGNTKINGPHQGAWVDTPSGEDWFLHFQWIEPHARVLHLQPMKWREDGWPVMGNDPGNTGRGEPVLAYKKPAVPAQPVAVPATSDEFEQAKLGFQWQWEANPRPEWWSLTAAPGAMRLNCVPLYPADARWAAANLLMQKFSSPKFTATTLLRFSPKADGDASGLIVFGSTYAWLGMRKAGDRTQLECVTFDRQKSGGAWKELVNATAQPKSNTVFLRVSFGEGAACRFSWSDDGASFNPIGTEFIATSFGWVGAKVGLFATAAPRSVGSGYADYDWFRFAPLEAQQ